MASQDTHDLVTRVGEALPYLRRYARALTGSQSSGDRFAAATLESLLVDTSIFDDEDDVKLPLFRTFHLIWQSAGAPLGEPDTELSQIAQQHMANLTPLTREALLLSSIERFSPAQIGKVMQVPPDEVTQLIDIAHNQMKEAIAGRVMVIEDEAIIALDLSAIVEEMGHRVTGVASTRSEAVALAARERPDLILADIQLADNSSGIDAVNDILARFADTPVIFITAFPERFLTGERPEPAFLISKPYAEDQVRSAVSQAMFFSSTATLTA